MNIEQYLNPTNPIAVVIVRILFMVFFIWFLILFCSAVSLLKKKHRLLFCNDVTILRDAIFKVNDSELSSDSFSSTSSTGTAKTVFQKYLQTKMLPESSAIATHLRAIFEAGLYESRLDTSELLRYTGQSLFTWNIFLRSLLGSFIVLGLLGTLVGLADSLIQFSEPLRPGTRAWSNEDVRSSIANLLTQLKGAFAPSIVGVALTILGVFFYTFYLRFVLTPIQQLLGHLTVNVWIPQLIPTTPQRLVETLKRSEEQMSHSFQAAEKVADFAKEIQNEASEFNTNLKSSNKVLKQLSEVGTTLSLFATRFGEGTDKLTSFQEELRLLYKESLSNSTSLRDNVAHALQDAQSFHSTVSTTLQNQGIQIQTIASSLKSYETAYITQRQQIDQTLQKLLVSVNQTLDQIDSKNKDLIEKFGNPLIEKLHQELSLIQNTLNVQLSAIHKQFLRLDAPMNDAAKKVADALDAVDRRTTALTEELKRLFLQREEYVDKQLTAFNDLSSKIVTLLTQMTSTTQTQSEGMQYLAQSINNFQEAIKSTKSVKFDQLLVQEAQKQNRKEEQLPKGILSRIVKAFKRDEQVKGQ